MAQGTLEAECQATFSARFSSSFLDYLGPKPASKLTTLSLGI